MNLSRVRHMLVVIGVSASAAISVPSASAFQADSTAKTSDNQKNNQADVDLTAKIRKEVVADRSLSTAAHNVKIISENGTVTLRGDVNSSAEKDTLLHIARRIAGASSVTDQVTVTPSK